MANIFGIFPVTSLWCCNADLMLFVPIFLGPGCQWYFLPRCLRHWSYTHQWYPSSHSAQAMKLFVLLSLCFLQLCCHVAMLCPWPPLHCCCSRLLFSKPFTEAPQHSILGFLSFCILMNKCIHFKGPSGYKPPPSLWIFNSNYLLDRSVFFHDRQFQTHLSNSSWGKH